MLLETFQRKLKEGFSMVFAQSLVEKRKKKT